MERKAHYALIGTFVLLFFLASIAFTAWLSNAQFDAQFDDYEVVFNGPVRGLSQGSEVRFNGLRVGEVTQLNLNPTNSGSVIAKIQVNAGTPVHTTSYAQLEPLGLTGLNYIQVFSGDLIEGQTATLLSDLPGRGPNRIAGRMSQIDSFVEGGTTVITSAQLALNRINLILTDDAIRDFKGILSNLNTLSGNLAAAHIEPDIIDEFARSIIKAADDVSAAAIAVDEAAQTTDSLFSNEAKVLLARAQQSLVQVDETLNDFSNLAGNGSELAVDTRDAINRLSNSGLSDIEETLDQFRELAASLNAIAAALESNPVGFIVGEEKQKVELPQ